MAKMFIYDENGKVIETKIKGRGRNPANSKVDEEGNIHVHPSVVKDTPKSMYITLAQNGKVKKEAKGRGRTRAGFVKMTDGEYAGHYVADQRDMMVAKVVEETVEDAVATTEE